MQIYKESILRDASEVLDTQNSIQYNEIEEYMSGKPPCDDT